MGRVTGRDAGDARPALVVLAAGLAKRYGGCKPLAPVGLHGEAVLDLTASDAIDAGFGPLVVVIGPQTGPAIRYHVRRSFPADVRVEFAEQTVPLGTAHAVLCARRLAGDGPFVVVNSDDLYGTDALTRLIDHLRGGDEHALVSFRLADTIVTDDPVTRGTCAVRADGTLQRLVERRKVVRRPDGDFDTGDGLDPVQLSADTPVSMNLWGFHPSIWPVLEDAVRAEHPAVSGDGTVADRRAVTSGAEVLLPEVVGAMIARARDGAAVRVIAAAGRCIGVTHADDLPAVRNELALMVGRGLRPEGLWHAAG
jgi:CTP:molybdopterin cytidylyltransferase MocA